jgi:hypothetical protein
MVARNSVETEARRLRSQQLKRNPLSQIESIEPATGTLTSGRNSVVHKETIRIKGVPVSLDAVRIKDQTFIISGKLITTAHLSDKDEWLRDVQDPDEVILGLKVAPIKIDLLRFWQRIPDSDAKFYYYKEWQQIAAIPIKDYNDWLTKQISPSARNKVRKSQKFGVAIQETRLSDELVHGIMEIFNQSPVRRGKRFWHYGKDFETVKKEMSLDLQDSIFITAYHENELIGFIKLYLTDRYAMITLILDKTTHRDKAPMNGMIAKAVEVCSQRKIPHIAYTVWRRGEHGQFQESNGFERIPVPEYFVPLTLRGKLALKLGLHRGVRGLVPERAMIWFLALRTKWYSWKYRQKTA